MREISLQAAVATPGATRFEVREVMRPQLFGPRGRGDGGDGSSLVTKMWIWYMNCQHGGIPFSIAAIAGSDARRSFEEPEFVHTLAPKMVGSALSTFLPQQMIRENKKPRFWDVLGLTFWKGFPGLIWCLMFFSCLEGLKVNAGMAETSQQTRASKNLILHGYFCVQTWNQSNL